MPPNLDIHTQPSPDKDIISFYDNILESLNGVACRLDCDGKVAAVSDNWEELAKRSGIAELSRNALLGKSFWDVAPDEESRLTLRGSLGSLARGQTGQAELALELTGGAKPLPLHITIHPIRDGETCAGFLVQGMDGTAERAARTALLDRERKLRELRSHNEQLSARITELEERLTAWTEEQRGKNEETSALREQQAALLEQMALWNAEREEAERRIAALQSENTLSQDEAREAKRQADALGEQLAELRRQQETESEQAANWSAQEEEYRERIADLQSEKARLEDNLIEREQQSRAVRLQTDELRRRIADLEGNCETLETVQRERENRSQHRVAAWERDVSEVLSAFRRHEDTFPEEFCRLAAKNGEAHAAALIKRDSPSGQFSLAALSGAHDSQNLSLNGGWIESALAKGCPVKFDRLLDREDSAEWLPLAEALNCLSVWAWPLSDDEGDYGLLLLCYADDDVNLSVECMERLNLHVLSSLPLLRARDEWANTPEATPAIVTTTSEDGFRMLAADLAEEFGNLLTGVLGHSSLIAAEMGETSAAVDDIRAIERSARGAARLTRRLSALCGANHKSPPPVDLGAFLKTYARDHAQYFAGESGGLALPDNSCGVRVENPTLEIILDGMAEHALRAGGETMQWTLSCGDSAAMLSLVYSGAPMLPPHWENGRNPARHKSPLPEIVFAREAARAHGGSLEITEDGSLTKIILQLPLTAPAEAAAR